ncbi:MAG: DUF4142 domain-containing protein [Acidobacteria bacterium]|nr:DUF4142 domain-containing protein [Acidobacteriota bacterium]
MGKLYLAAGVIAAGVLAVTPVAAQNNPDNAGMHQGNKAQNLPRASVNWLDNAVRGNLAEVQMAQLAESKAENPAVKQYAQRIVQDHDQLQSQLQNVARQFNVNLPDTPDRKQQQEMNRLKALSGAQFDKVYMQHMIRDHRKDVNDFQREANRGATPEIKNLASQSLPTLQEHLRLAQQTYSQIGGNTGTASRSSRGSANRSRSETHEKYHKQK